MFSQIEMHQYFEPKMDVFWIKPVYIKSCFNVLAKQFNIDQVS